MSYTKGNFKKIISLALAGVLIVGAASSLIVGLVLKYRQNHFFASAATLVSTKGASEGNGERSERAVKAYRKFSGDLFHAVDDKEHNALISNLSAYLALAILSQGAAGESKEQLTSLLGLEDEELFEFALYLYRHYSDNEQFQDIVRVANSLWIREQENFSVENAFLQVNADYFGSDIYTGAFNGRTVSAINKWVSNQTDGKIKEIVKKISKDAMLFLVNTVLVQSDWREPWESYSKMTFTASGEEKKVDGLFDTTASYYDSGNALAFTYELESGLSFMGILPNGELKDYRFDGEELNKLLSSRITSRTEEKEGEIYLYRYNVHCRLPRFSYSYETSLKDALSSLGAPVIFDKELADFSGISSTTPLYVEEVRQKTVIDVNKKGVSVAGATIVEMGPTSAAPPDHVIATDVEIHLDRPFLYMIYEQATGLPLFIGSVYEI